MASGRLNALARRLKKFTGALLFVLGALATLANFFPRVDASIRQTVAPTRPFATPFVIQNANQFPIFYVSFHCQVVEARDRNGNSFANWQVAEFRPQTPVLWPGQQDTVFCPSLIDTPIPLDQATVALRAFFRSLLWWPRHERRWCYSLTPSARGEPQWLPIAACPDLPEFELPEQPSP